MKVRQLVVVAAMLLVSLASIAQEETPPHTSVEQLDTLQDLLELIKTKASEGSRQNAARIERFREARDERQRMLDEVLGELKSEQERSETLTQQFEQNETDLVDLEERLRVRIGNFGELFGVVRETAGDTVVEIQNSLVSAQFPDRAAVTRRMAVGEELPSLADLQDLQLTLLTEMAHSGQVARFNAEVTDPSGKKAHGEIIRIGTFNLVHNGQFLVHEPESGSLQVLARQPPGHYLSLAEELEESTTGAVAMAIDPTRGQLLKLRIHVPNLVERVRQGGYVGYTIIVLGLIGFFIGIWRLIVLQRAGQSIRAQLLSPKPNENNPLGRILGVYESHHSANLDALVLKIDEAILRETPVLERYQGIIKVLAAVAPLLGLLGTVIGMIITFQQLTLYGTGDPKLMAGGISQALMTTVLGLVVAIPLLLMQSVISSSSQRLIEILEEQSAGLIARRAESEDTEQTATGSTQ